MSVIIQVANDVAALVSAVQTDGENLAAVPDYAPDLDFAKVRERRILIVPATLQRSNADRSSTAQTVKVSICYAEKIAPADIAGRVGLMEQIAEAVVRQTLVSGNQPYALITSAEFDPIYDADILRNSRVFFSICTVTAKVLR